MAPLQPLVTPRARRLQRKNSLREGGGGGGGGGSGKKGNHPVPKRAASFNGRTTATALAGPSDTQRELRRPKTQPDLFAAATGGGGKMASPVQEVNERRVPAKVLVNVNVLRSLGALQVLASTEWSVDQLLEAAVKQYLKEGRRPLLRSNADPSSFGLHYSQFSLQCLDPKEKLIGLGSRNFFLCPKSPALASDPGTTSKEATSSTTQLPPTACSNQAGNASKITIPWLRFMDFLM